MELKELLKKLRNDRGISQQQLANDLHISRSVVAKWETGLVIPNDETLKIIEKYYKVSLNDFMNNENLNTINNKNKKFLKIIILSFSIVIALTAIILLVLPKKETNNYNLLKNDLSYLGSEYTISLIDNTEEIEYQIDINNIVTDKILKYVSQIEYILYDKDEMNESHIDDIRYKIVFSGEIKIQLSKYDLMFDEELFYFKKIKNDDNIDEIINLILNHYDKKIFNNDGLILMSNYTLKYNETKKCYEILGLINYNIETLVLPESYNDIPIKIIAKQAFKDCINLKTIVLHNNLQRIEEYAFENCSNLIEVNIPDSVTYLGKGVFSKCYSIEKMTLPFIGSGIWEEETNNLKYIFGGESVPKSLKTLKIIKTKRIPDNAFADIDSIETIIIGKDIMTIGKNAFKSCGINTLIFEPGINLISLGQYAFLLCSVKEIYYGGTVEDWCKIDMEWQYSNPMGFIDTNINNMKNDKTFYFYDYSKPFSEYLNYNNYKEYTEIVIPNTITSIKNYTFNGFDKVEKFIFEDGIKLESIGLCSFSFCAIKEIVIPDTVTNIDLAAFEYCINLENIKLPSSLKTLGNAVFRKCVKLEYLEIPESIETIGNMLCIGCENLKEVKINGNPKTIDWALFEDCNNIEKITIPRIPTIKIKYGDTETKCSALCVFFGGKSYSDNLTKVPESLKEVVITNDLDILDNAFRGCKNLINIILPKNLESIGANAFYGCHNLEEIIIPLSCISIDEYVFYECYRLSLYCEIDSAPEGFNTYWNVYDGKYHLSVVWDYKG